MKVVGQVDELPTDKADGQGRYDTVVAALKDLPLGKWLRVECESDKETVGVRNAATNRGFRAKKRGLDVYIARRES